MFAPLEDTHAEPAPVNAMLLDEAVFNLHRFHKILLVGIGTLARIFPNQPFAIGKITLPIKLPRRRLRFCQLLEQLPQFIAAVKNAAVGLQQMAHERAFQYRVRCIKLEESIHVELRKRVVPFAINMFH